MYEFHNTADNFVNVNERISVRKYYSSKRGKLSLLDFNQKLGEESVEYQRDTIKVDQSFMVNKININTRLNKDF